MLVSKTIIITAGSFLIALAVLTIQTRMTGKAAILTNVTICVLGSAVAKVEFPTHLAPSVSG